MSEYTPEGEFLDVWKREDLPPIVMWDAGNGLRVSKRPMRSSRDKVWQSVGDDYAYASQFLRDWAPQTTTEERQMHKRYRDTARGVDLVWVDSAEWFAGGFWLWSLPGNGDAHLGVGSVDVLADRGILEEIKEEEFCYVELEWSTRDGVLCGYVGEFRLYACDIACHKDFLQFVAEKGSEIRIGGSLCDAVQRKREGYTVRAKMRKT